MANVDNVNRAKSGAKDLSGADLREADLSNARLLGTDLQGADLRRANLGGAKMWKADLGEADLNRHRSKATGKLWESDWAMVWTVREGKLAKGQILEDTFAQAAALHGRNKARLQQAIDQWNNDDLDAYLELYDPNAKVHHIPADMPPGITGIRQFYQGLRAILPDIRIRIEDIFEEDDRVALRYTLTAIHNESGKQIVSPAITTLHFSDGRCIERWDAEE